MKQMLTVVIYDNDEETARMAPKEFMEYGERTFGSNKSLSHYVSLYNMSQETIKGGQRVEVRLNN